MKRAFVFLVGLLASGAFGQHGCLKLKPASTETWERIDYSKTLLTLAQVHEMKPITLLRVRGIIFGRHGRVFKEIGIQSFLESRAWYHANPHFSNSSLNETERKDLDLVRGAEAEHHKTVRPGDLRFWINRKIGNHLTEKDLASAHIMRAEIEAIHGKTFPSEPALQQYFNDRYWYKPNPNYNTSILSPIERDNLKTMAQLEEKARGTDFAPESIIAYADRPLPENALKNQTLFNLRLMRNAFYALRGRAFKTDWLQQYFAQQEWYQPRSQLALSHTEEVNVAKILKQENAIHESLSKTSLPKATFKNLFVEDLSKLRNEIYARHGKVFKQKWLQDYFASLTWYKANPNYSDSQLTSIERHNLKTIASVENVAHRQFAMEEG